MDKVHSAIKSLECVDILQVNVEEDTEVVPFGTGTGTGTGSVTIEEMDASNAEPPVHADNISERKRKSSAASDASTTPTTRKKVKTDKDNSSKSNTVFDERCNQLLRFKEEFGHCNVPVKYPGNPSLGQWCSQIRTAYNQIQKGMKTNHNLSQGRRERLEEIGFQWQVYDEAFEKRCRELIAFKEDFGHCNVPVKYSGNPSLGQWCSQIRTAYNQIQKGMKTNHNLSQGRRERLEEIGFQWQVYDEAFEKRCRELIAFKEDFGHCNVPVKYSGKPSLGQWCSQIRTANKKIQKGMKTNHNLSQGRRERLEEIGFQWQGVDYYEAFEKRCRELIAFKEDFGHCYVDRSYVDNPSLGQWCNNVRCAYNQIQKGMKTNHNLSQGRRERLEEIGFQWNKSVEYNEAFEKRCRELIAFKEEFGHCNVLQRYADNPSLGRWCSHMRNTYKKIQKGMKTSHNLSQDRIERLEEIGFQFNYKNTKMLHACVTTNY